MNKQEIMNHMFLQDDLYQDNESKSFSDLNFFLKLSKFSAKIIILNKRILVNNKNLSVLQKYCSKPS